MGLHHMMFRRRIDRVPCGLRLKTTHRRLKTFWLLRLVNIASLGERLETWCLVLLGSAEGRWLDMETAVCLLELITRMLLRIVEASAFLQRLRLFCRKSLPAITFSVVGAEPLAEATAAAEGNEGPQDPQANLQKLESIIHAFLITIIVFFIFILIVIIIVKSSSRSHVQKTQKKKGQFHRLHEEQVSSYFFIYPSGFSLKKCYQA